MDCIWHRSRGIPGINGVKDGLDIPGIQMITTPGHGVHIREDTGVHVVGWRDGSHPNKLPLLKSKS
jgi:hypothetical protein